MSELMVIEPGSHELNPAQVKQQMSMLTELMESVLKKDVHYGPIPGCGDKPAIFLPGAQKLGMMFNLGPRYKIESADEGGGHRQYEVVCELYHRGTGRFIGEGVGVCTTMESKYRYRSEATGQDVPSDYWKHRDKELLGGPSFTPKKIDGKWKIFQRVEHDNPADYYNTVKKIAKKRAYNDAILTSTAASDIFVPDDETDGLGDDPSPVGEPERKVDQPQSRSGNAATTDQPNAGALVITEKQGNMIYAKLQAGKISMESFLSAFNVKDHKDLPKGKINDALSWIEGRAS